MFTIFYVSAAGIGIKDLKVLEVYLLHYYQLFVTEGEYNTFPSIIFLLIFCQTYVHVGTQAIKGRYVTKYLNLKNKSSFFWF